MDAFCFHDHDQIYLGLVEYGYNHGKMYVDIVQVGNLVCAIESIYFPTRYTRFENSA